MKNYVGKKLFCNIPKDLTHKTHISPVKTHGSIRPFMILTVQKDCVYLNKEHVEKCNLDPNPSERFEM